MQASPVMMCVLRSPLQGCNCWQQSVAGLFIVLDKFFGQSTIASVAAHYIPCLRSTGGVEQRKWLCSMVTHMLQALSESAKAWNGPCGSDIPVEVDTKLGRKVSSKFCLPQNWAQVSQTHCTIFSEDHGVSTARLSDCSQRGTRRHELQVSLQTFLA